MNNIFTFFGVIVLISLNLFSCNVDYENRESEKLINKKSNENNLSKKSVWDFASEMADAKCNKETAKNNGKAVETKKWDVELKRITKECEEAYAGNKDSLVEVDKIYEKWLKRCPAISNRKD
jgi:hypothetical protein